MTRITPARMAVLCVLVLVVFLGAAPAFAAPPNPIVSGTLRGSDGAVTMDGQVIVSHQVRGAWRTVVTLPTTSGGTWTFNGKPDYYRFEFSAPFADPQTRYLTTVRGTNYTLDVTLQAYGNVSGIITDLNGGAGLAGGTVELYQRNGDGTWPNTPYATTTAGSSGAYSVGNLPCGVYAVKASASACVGAFFGGATIDAATPLDVTRGATSAASFALQSLGEIGGTITDSVSGLPLSGASIELYRSNGDGTWALVDTVFSGADGSYSSGQVLTGTWAVKAAAAGHFDGFYGGGSTPATAGQIGLTRGITFPAGVALVPLPTGPSTIRGHVSQGLYQTPYVNCSVFIFKQRPDGTWPTSFGPGTEYDWVFTDALGNWVNETPLALGNYKVRFYPPHGSQEWYDHVPTISEATTLSITYEGQSYTGIDAWLFRP